MLQNLAHLIALSAAATLVIGCQQQTEQPAMGNQPESSLEIAAQQYQQVIVDASCGQCQFDLSGAGCQLAVRIDGEAYFVDGTSIGDHGDAHAADGFCNAVRHARVSGHVNEGRFVATHFELLPDTGE